MAQLPQRLRLYLTDPLTGHPELPADLFQGPTSAVLQSEPKLKHPGFEGTRYGEGAAVRVSSTSPTCSFNN